VRRWISGAVLGNPTNLPTTKKQGGTLWANRLLEAARLDRAQE
jgi:hypothetical protein